MGQLQVATVAGGCFWCTEAVFQGIDGVLSVTPGYTDGTVVDPDYASVCKGTTGHAEAVRIMFDPDVVSFEVLLRVFFMTHDPTTLDRQGHDVGSQYRSAIFFQDEVQQIVATELVAQLESAAVFNAPIVTQIRPATTFYPAESYHHAYFARNPMANYCQIVIAPKLRKLQAELAQLVQRTR